MVRIPQPQQSLQIKVVRDLPNAIQFVVYIDAIGELDGAHYLMDWKTATSRYPEQPAGLLALDPQLRARNKLGMMQINRLAT